MIGNMSNQMQQQQQQQQQQLLAMALMNNANTMNFPSSQLAELQRMQNMQTLQNMQNISSALQAPNDKMHQMQPQTQPQLQTPPSNALSGSNQFSNLLQLSMLQQGAPAQNPMNALQTALEQQQQQQAKQQQQLLSALSSGQTPEIFGNVSNNNNNNNIQNTLALNQMAQMAQINMMNVHALGMNNFGQQNGAFSPNLMQEKMMQQQLGHFGNNMNVNMNGFGGLTPFDILSASLTSAREARISPSQLDSDSDKNSIQSSKHTENDKKKSSKTGAAAATPQFRYILVCDPQTKERVKVPSDLLSETKGLNVHLNSLSSALASRKDGVWAKVKDVHLCMLHQKGKCRSGRRCNQIHVDRTYVQQRREEFENRSLNAEKIDSSHSRGSSTQEEKNSISENHSSDLEAGLQFLDCKESLCDSDEVSLKDFLNDLIQ